MADKEETRCLVRFGPETPGFYKLDTCAKAARREAKAARTARAKAEKAKARQKARFKEAETVIPPGYDAMKTCCSAVDSESSEEEFRHLPDCEPAPGHPVPADEEANGRRAAHRRACDLLRLLFFTRSIPKPILSAEELDAEKAAQHEKEVLRCSVSRLELAASNNKIVLQCLEWYNSMNPGNEYEPAPGPVARCSDVCNSLLWTHGNFVARRKRSGCFSFLPAPRTLFFFELLDRLDVDGVDEVITCTPLDEPVTEAYIFCGVRLGWGTRRDGRCDRVCKTCYRQFHVPHMDLKRTCACGDSKVEDLCEMCYLTSYVLHPSRGGFAFGHNKESFAYS